MLKREELYAQAFENKRKALARKKAEYEMKYAAFCSVEPRLSELDRALAAEGAQTAITALSGNSAALEALKKRINELSDEKQALLKKMGLEDIKYDCPICNDTGYKGGKICECVRDEVKKITVKSLSEEFSIEECRFDNFDLSFYPETADDGSSPHDKMQQLLAFCKDYVKTFSATNSKSLIFLGNTGLGKTHLSFAIVGELLEKGFDVVYGSAYSIFSKIESENFLERSTENFDAVISCDLLVIDDLGSEYTTPYFQSTLFNIVNTRQLAKKPTIINTNLSPSELENRYTPRVSSRIFGSYAAKKFAGSDIRMQKMINRHNNEAQNV